MESTASSKTLLPVCELCAADGGDLLYRDTSLRVVAVGGDEGARYPGFCRVIWNAHIREMTDLSHDDRLRIMRAVFIVEGALRLSLNPDKINLASLGNMTPHLHWHIIPRRRNDTTFPRPIWAQNIETNPASVATLAIGDEWRDAVRAALHHP